MRGIIGKQWISLEQVIEQIFAWKHFRTVYFFIQKNVELTVRVPE